MRTILITTALAEVKTIADRIAKRRKAEVTYAAYVDRYSDPLAKGGSTIQQFYKESEQSVKQLETNLSAIRIAIMRKNLDSPVVVNGTSKTVQEWLVWKKEIVSARSMQYELMKREVVRVRAELDKQIGSATKIEEKEAFKAANVVPAFDQVALLKEEEEIAKTLGSLDSTLSIFNATTSIEVPDDVE